MPRNGLSRAALMDPGTADLLGKIAKNPLSMITLQGHEDAIALSSNLQSLMKYIVSCALDPGVPLDAGVKVGGAELVWSGELGLCGQHSAFGDWSLGSPKSSCLEIVSSCVLARVNALGKQVILSVRGTSMGLFPLQSKVPVEQAYREKDGTPIASFQPCTAPSDQSLPMRNCGWQARYVGRCTAQQPVTLTLQAAAPVAVRVCSGIYGCDSQDWSADMAGIPGYPGYPTPWYSSVLGSYGPLAPDTSVPPFTCPGNGISPDDPSYFSIMLAADSGDVGNADVKVSGGAYPSPEQDVFTYREGAFFGNIFEPVGSGPREQVLFDDQYACFSDVWSLGEAYLADRLCAEVSEVECFEHVPKPCLWKTDHAGELDPGHRCNAQSCGAEQNYLGCAWPPPMQARTWDQAITVFLNHPCDLASDPETCGKAYPQFHPMNCNPHCT